MAAGSCLGSLHEGEGDASLSPDVPALLTVPECARRAGISVKRMRAILKVRGEMDPELMHGTPARPLVQRDALAKLLGHSAMSVEQRLDDHNVRITALERKLSARS